MKIVVAPDSFKGSLTAPQVAEALTEGLKSVWPDAAVDEIPLADGGEGTTRALVEATGGRVETLNATGPLGERVEAFFGVLGDGVTGVVEMAAASGLPLVPEHRRNPMVTTTYGTGELVKAALDAGCTRVILGIGGSATNDGGVGMAQALGASFRDARGDELSPGGGALSALNTIDLTGLDERLIQTEIVVACDVQNPLVGPEGASRVYGPQKGANPADVDRLEQALQHLATRIREELGRDVAQLPGAGAAGGLGAGVVAFFNARLMPGIDLILDAVNFRDRVRDADLAVTGEGMVDQQTAFGKTPSGVLRVAGEFGVPVVAIGGGIAGDLDLLDRSGFAAVMDSTPRPMPLREALAEARVHVVHAGRTVARLIALGSGK